MKSFDVPTAEDVDSWTWRSADDPVSLEDAGGTIMEVRQNGEGTTSSTSPEDIVESDDSIFAVGRDVVDEDCGFEVDFFSWLVESGEDVLGRVSEVAELLTLLK